MSDRPTDDHDHDHDCDRDEDRSVRQEEAAGDAGRSKLSRRMFLGGAAAAASMAATPSLRARAADAAEPGHSVLEGPDGLQVEVRPYGRSRSQVTSLRGELEASVLDPYLSGNRHRWLSFKRDVARRSVGLPAAPEVFTATVYDYDHGRTLDVAGRLDDPAAARVEASSRQPIPVEAEFEEAVDILRGHPTLGPAITGGHLLAYRPMPPLLPVDGGRPVAVGLYAPDPPAVGDDDRHRLVGVDLQSGETILEHPVAASGSEDCPAPIWAGGCEWTGWTGQAEITVTQNGEELWRLVVVRPRESSGTNGSGAELRHVSFRGRSVLHRAHVPILNVIYQPEDPGIYMVRCGPTYRDWLDSESCFEAHGTDVADGVRLCDEEPATIMATGSDGGNFRGAAVYLDGSDLVVTSELTAGWYRYITEWKLHDDGNITPRFGFSAVRNPCTCRHHVHHAYWRLDLAVDGLDDHRVEEHDDESLLDPGGWRTLDLEASRDRNPDTLRYWRITNRTTGAGYRLIPGRDDARAEITDVYGAGDTWFLRYHPDELDDGQGFTTNPALSRARLDAFVDGEQLDGRDVVAWYAGHWHHEHGDDGDWASPKLRTVGLDD